MNAVATLAAGAPVRLTASFDFDAARIPGRTSLQYIRASALAQARLQLAVLSGNRRGALREIDRLVEIDRQLERLAAGGELAAEMAAEDLAMHLADQKEAIAGEKLALVAAVEFPRLAPLPRPECDTEHEHEGELVLIEEADFGARWGWIGLLALLTALAATAFAVAFPLLAAG